MATKTREGKSCDCSDRNRVRLKPALSPSQTIRPKLTETQKREFQVRRRMPVQDRAIILTPRYLFPLAASLQAYGWRVGGLHGLAHAHAPCTCEAVQSSDPHHPCHADDGSGAIDIGELGAAFKMLGESTRAGGRERASPGDICPDVYDPQVFTCRRKRCRIWWTRSMRTDQARGHAGVEGCLMPLPSQRRRDPLALAHLPVSPCTL